MFKESCIICKKEGTTLCENCKNDISSLKLLEKDEIRYLYKYDEPLRTAFKRYKFNGKKHYSKTFSCIFLKDLDYDEIDIITYIPISFKRYHERGYNQVLEILKFSKFKAIKTLHKRHRKRQSELNAIDREKNAKNSFVVIKNVKGKKILLFDDILTTGATINSAKNALLKAGAKSVDIIIFMKAI